MTRSSVVLTLFFHDTHGMVSVSRVVHLKAQPGPPQVFQNYSVATSPEFLFILLFSSKECWCNIEVKERAEECKKAQNALFTVTLIYRYHFL